MARHLPFLAINHLEAHALTARLPGLEQGGAPFPYLLFLLSGGHSQCIAVHGVGRYRKLGGTIDDAAGEAFDKVAKQLGLGWPGGPALEKLATEGDPKAFAFPRPMLLGDGCDLSFSGLKTAVVQAMARLPNGAPTSQQAADIAASFQQAVADVLADRAVHAMALMRAILANRRHAGRRRRRRRQQGDPHLARPGGPGQWISHGRAADAALLRQCRHGGMGRDRAPSPRPHRHYGVRRSTALAPGRAGAARAGMNYRHDYHAGNFADCFKHALLIALVEALRKKPAPFGVLDTHAGAGHYDLDSEAAHAHQ